MSFWKRAVMILTVAATMSVSTQVLAAKQYKETRQTQATIADAVIARPLGVVVTGIGAVLFVVLEHVLGGVSEFWHIYLGAILLGVVLFARGGLIGLIAGRAVAHG